MTHFTFKKSSNKLRMKALVGWNTLFQVSELINMIVFFTRRKNDMVKGDIIIIKCNSQTVRYLSETKLIYMGLKLIYMSLKVS